MPSTSPPPARLRIATFNVKDFFLPRVQGEAGVVEEKLANVARHLRRADADVVALQEIGDEELLTRLVRSELRDLGYGAPVLGNADRRGIRCVVLSRLPVLWSQVHAPATLPFPVFVEGDPPPFAARLPMRRGVVHVRVESALGEIDLFAVHFKSNLGVPLRGPNGEPKEAVTARERGEASLRSLVSRAAEALYVRGLVDEVVAKSPDHGACVLGDLNDTADSLPVRILCGVGPAGPGSLRRAADLAPEASRFSCYHAGGKTLIDHVLLGERLHRAVTGVHFYNEELRDHGPHVEPVPLTADSDHALCVVELHGASEAARDGVGAPLA